MSHYEIMYIIPVKMTGEEATPSQDKVREMLQAEGAKITHEESLGKKKLAYPINQVRHGTYIVVESDLDPTKVKKVSEWFRLSSDIVRAQIISKKLKTPEELAREKAFQEKLAKLRADNEAEEKKVDVKEEPKTKVDLADLDKKLEKILEEEIIK